jgi:hypothetical protein
MIVTLSRTSRRPVMHRGRRNYFQRLRSLRRRLRIAGPAQQAVQLVRRDHRQADQQGAITAIMVVVEEHVRRLAGPTDISILLEPGHFQSALPASSEASIGFCVAPICMGCVAKEPGSVRRFQLAFTRISSLGSGGAGLSLLGCRTSHKDGRLQSPLRGEGNGGSGEGRANIGSQMVHCLLPTEVSCKV